MGNTESLLLSPFKNKIHFKTVNKYSYSLQINLIYLPSNYGKKNSMKEKLLLTLGIHSKNIYEDPLCSRYHIGY